MREDGKIGCVQKAMELLRQISDAEGDEICLKELSARAGIPKSTCVHILNTLADDGYVQKTPARGGYTLGPMSYYIAREGRYQKRLVRLCHPVMAWLNRQTGQTVILSVLHNSDKYIVHYVSGERSLSQKGSILLGHLFETATGRAMFANLHSRERERIIQRLGMPAPEQWPEAATREGMSHELASIRERGYVVVTKRAGEVMDIGVGGAIRDCEGVVGAIGMALRYIPSNASMDDDEMCRYVGHLSRALNEANHRLAFESLPSQRDEG